MKQYDFDEIINRTNTNCVKWDLREALYGASEVIPLWVADMDFRTPDFVIEALRKRIEHEVFGYFIHPNSFYEAVKQWVWRRSGWNISVDDLTFSPGIVPAINFAVNALTRKNEKIMINQPVYHPFIAAITDHERILVNNPLIVKNGRYTIDFEDFERKLSEGIKMYILCNPHNPVGRVWTVEELQHIAELCIKYNVLIVSDDIHSDLILKPNQYTHLASLSEKTAQQTLTFMAPSKTFNLAGVATSVVHTENKTIRTAFINYVEKMHLGHGNLFGDIALEAAYAQGDEWLEQLLNYIGKNCDYVVDFLNKNIPQIKTDKPEGTYLMWLDCRQLGLSRQQLDQFMIEKAGLALNSGYIFGDEGEGFMRLNVASPFSVIAKAMKQLKQAVNTLL